MATQLDRIADDVAAIREQLGGPDGLHVRMARAEEAIDTHAKDDVEYHAQHGKRLDTMESKLDVLVEQSKARRAELDADRLARGHQLRLAKIAAGVITAALPVLGAIYGVGRVGAEGVSHAATAVMQTITAPDGADDTDTDGGDGGADAGSTP